MLRLARGTIVLFRKLGIMTMPLPPKFFNLLLKLAILIINVIFPSFLFNINHQNIHVQAPARPGPPGGPAGSLHVAAT